MSKEKGYIDQSYDKYQESRRRARDIAKKFGISLDEGEEHFVIPVYDADGKEIRKEKLSARFDWIPMKVEAVEENGKKYMKATESADIETAIEAVKKYPELPLREAVKKIDQEKETGSGKK